MSVLPGAYQKNDPRYLGDQRQYDDPKEAFKVVVRCIETLFGDRPISLIDTACASGAFLYYARSRLNVETCVGTEISDEHLEQARKYVPGVEFVLDSLLEPQHPFGRQFDVCTCLGTLPIFDDIAPILKYLLSLVKNDGALYLFDIVNDEPVDMIMRYRRVSAAGAGEWQCAYNVRSRQTFEALVRDTGFDTAIDWIDFEMPLPIPKTNEPMRTWTMQTEFKTHQIVAGTGQLLNFKVIQIRKR
ncbi:MAG TPA: class I SAM-dependent methyltransferase [Longimicrobium sp.]